MSSNYTLPYQPSLASATNTRVDSACKHHHQCRVSTDDIQNMLSDTAEPLKMQREKYKYCVHKDEMVLSVGRPWCKNKAIRKTNNAYPRVISNLGDMDGNSPDSKTYHKMIIYMYHYCRGLREKDDIIRLFQQNEVQMSAPAFTLVTNVGVGFFEYTTTGNTRSIRLTEDTSKWLSILSDHKPMGYAQTLGWAHPNSGDTMTTVMIGGCRTVMNGDFEVITGDLIQWYWPFERTCFLPDGTRLPVAHPLTINSPVHNINPVYAATADLTSHSPFTLEKDAQGRESFHTQVYGQTKEQPKMVARIKPYFRDMDYPRMYDQVRVFAVAISSARPHEMVDIKICRQSM